MRRFIADRLTYANVVSTLCLFVLLGGGAYAAAKLKKDSVGSKQVKNGSIKGADVKDGGITGKDVKESSLAAVPQADSAGSAETAGTADDAAAVGGVGIDGLVRAFGASNDDPSPGLVFAVPELNLELLGDTEAATASCFRIRNTGASGSIAVADTADQTGSLFSVPSGSTSANRCEDGPLVAVNDANPDQMLVFGCASLSRAYCFGQLIEAPAR